MSRSEINDHAWNIIVLRGNSFKPVSQQQIAAVEAATRQQCNAKLWSCFHAGHIKAACFKAVCHAGTDPLPQSHVTGVCYPEQRKFLTKATEWGCKNECHASDKVKEIMTQNHVNLTMAKCGFVIHHEFPFIGATSNAMVSCDCCSKGWIEVKCPYWAQNEDTSNLDIDCLDKDHKLKTTLAYFYQVQCQMATCCVPYCEFAVWTKKGLPIERINHLENSRLWGVLFPEHF